MDFQFGDSFDRYSATLPVTTHWTQNAGTGGVNFNGGLVAGRFGGQAYQILTGAIASENFINRGLLAATSECSCGFAFNRSSYALNAAGGGVPIWRVRYGLNVVLQLGVDFLGRLVVGRTNFTSTLLGRSDPGLFDASAWYFLAPELEVGPTGRISVALDGVEIYSLPVGDTDGVGAGLIDSIDLVAASAGFQISAQFDDLHFLNVASRWAQPSKVEPLYPNSDVGPNQWTRNTGASDFSAIDEAQSDGDVTRLTDATIGHKSRHGLTDLSTVPAAIYAVQVSTVARKDDAGLCQIRANLGSGATTADGATQTLGVNYDERLDPYDADPDTAAAFNATGVNDLEVELEVIFA